MRWGEARMCHLECALWIPAVYCILSGHIVCATYSRHFSCRSHSTQNFCSQTISFSTCCSITKRKAESELILLLALLNNQPIFFFLHSHIVHMSISAVVHCICIEWFVWGIHSLGQYLCWPSSYTILFAIRFSCVLCAMCCVPVPCTFLYVIGPLLFGRLLREIE